VIIVTIKLVIVCINCIFSVSEIDDNDDPSCMSTDDPGSSEARWNHVADIVAGNLHLVPSLMFRPIYFVSAYLSKQVSKKLLLARNKHI